MGSRLVRFGLLAFSLLLTQSAWAALPSNTIFEVRSTNGANTNGGCAADDASTDYSDQNSAQQSWTNLTTSGAAATTITTADANFTSAMVDNCIQISSGTNFDAGFYMITTFTDSSNVVLDRTPTSGGAGSGGNGAVGGAVASLDHIEDDLVAGTHVWVKDEAVLNEELDFTVGGSVGNPIHIEGYSSTRGDNPTGDSRPEWDTAGSGGDIVDIASASVTHYIFENLIFDNANGSAFHNQGDQISVVNCQFSNASSFGINMENNDRVGAVIGSQIFSNGNDGIQTVGNSIPSRIVGNVIYGNTGACIDYSNSESFIAFNLCYENSGGGIKTNDDLGIVLNNTMVDNSGASSDGFTNTTTIASIDFVVMNNISSDNGAYGYDFTNSNNALFLYNFGTGNGTAFSNNALDLVGNDSSTSASFTDAANDDYSIGTGLKAAALDVNGPSTTGYLDPGAIQREEPAGSGSGTTAFTFIGN